MSRLMMPTITVARRRQNPDQATDVDDWRNHVSRDHRLKIVNKIMETLKRHLPFSGQEGLQELKQIAIRFEEKIYTATTSQSDYLRKISLKMLTMETTSQNPMANSLQPNAAGGNKNPQDPDLERTAMSRLMVPTITVARRRQNPDHATEVEDWRNLLPRDSRLRVVNKIATTLMRHLPFSGQGLQEVRRFAIRFEGKIYNSATSQSDYLRKISLKMLMMETRSHNLVPNPPCLYAAMGSGSNINS